MTRVLGIDASRAVGRRRTGTEHYAVHVIEALGALEPEERVLLYVNAKHRPALNVPNTFHYRLLPWRRGWTHLRLSAEVALHRPDVLFVPSHVVPLYHPPTVVTIHDVGYRDFPAAHPLRSRLALEATTRWSVATARRVIVPSRHTGSALQRVYNVSEQKLVVIPHGYDPRFRPLAAPLIQEGLERMGIRQPFLLFVGTLQPRKNLHRVLQAFTRAVADGLPHDLVLAGQRGWLTEPLFRELDRAVTAVRGRMHVTGYVDDADLPVLYNGADALVFPSLSEGFGLPALEAMACGVPVLASNTSSLPEVIGDAGLLVDPLDIEAIATGMRVIVDPTGPRDTLRQRGLQRAALFSWQRAARATLDLLRDVADSPGQSRTGTDQGRRK